MNHSKSNPFELIRQKDMHTEKKSYIKILYVPTCPFELSAPRIRHSVCCVFTVTFYNGPVTFQDFFCGVCIVPFAMYSLFKVSTSANYGYLTSGSEFMLHRKKQVLLFLLGASFITPRKTMHSPLSSWGRLCCNSSLSWPTGLCRVCLCVIQLQPRIRSVYLNMWLPVGFIRNDFCSLCNFLFWRPFLFLCW